MTRLVESDLKMFKRVELMNKSVGNIAFVLPGVQLRSIQSAFAWFYDSQF